MNQWEVVIGIETHAQLATVSKIFSGASTAFGAEPNTQACAVDLALPGVLPVLNKKAVDCRFLRGKIIFTPICPRATRSARWICRLSSEVPLRWSLAKATKPMKKWFI